MIFFLNVKTHTKSPYKYIYAYFSSTFFRICQIHCFLHSVAAIPKVWHVWIAIWCKNHNSNASTLWNSSNMSKVHLNFQIKSVERVTNYLQNHPFKAWYFVKCKYPNSYSVIWLICNTQDINVWTYFFIKFDVF